MKQLKLEVAFEVYGEEGFSEKVFREKKIFVADSPKFGKGVLLKVARWIAECMRTYNKGVHLTPAQVEYLGKREGKRNKIHKLVASKAFRKELDKIKKVNRMIKCTTCGEEYLFGAMCPRCYGGLR